MLIETFLIFITTIVYYNNAEIKTNSPDKINQVEEITTTGEEVSPPVFRGGWDGN